MPYLNPRLGQEKSSSTEQAQGVMEEREKTKKTHRYYAGHIHPSIQECSPLDKIYANTLHLLEGDIQHLFWKKVEERFSYVGLDRRHCC